MRFARALDEYPHGSRSRYRLGCRCTDCTGANTLYGRQRARARAKGYANPLIDATEVRAWLLCLEEKGIGVRRAGKLSGIRWPLLYRLRSGQQKHVRKLTAQAILQIKPSLAYGQTVPSYHTRQLVDSLVTEGYTKARLARQLGLQTPSLQLHNPRVTVKNALKVRSLWKRLMGED